MITFSFILIYLLIISFVYINLKRSGVLVYISITWWFLWIIISYNSISGYFIPGVKTLTILISFFVSLCIGIYLKKYIIIKPFFKIKCDDIHELFKEKVFFILIITFILPFSILGCIRTIYLLSTKFSQASYRSEVFGLNTGSSELFFNFNHLASLYWNLIIPLYWSILLIGIIYFLKYKKIRLLIMSFCLFILDSITTVGRFGMHYVIFTIILIFLLSYTFNLIQLNKKKLSIILLIILSILVSMFSIRSGKDITHSFDHYVIGYHTSSLVILDQELNNPNSIIHDKTLGSSFWTGIFNSVRYLFANILGIPWVGEGDVMGGYLHPSRLVGFDKNNIPLYNNAFGTIFFSMYRDGGFLGIILYGIFFGYILGITSKSLPNKKSDQILFHISLIYILVYGIFQPFTSGPILQAIVISTIFLKFPVKTKKNTI